MSLPGTKNSTDISLQDELTYSSSFLPPFLLGLVDPVSYVGFLQGIYSVWTMNIVGLKVWGIFNNLDFHPVSFDSLKVFRSESPPICMRLPF